MMKQKYEFSVRMQQRHLKAIVEVTAQALPWGRGIGSASAAFRTRERACGGQALPSGHGSGLGGQALPSGHGSGLLAEGLVLQEGSRSGL